MGLFGSSKQSENALEANSNTIISTGTVIDGNIHTPGNIRIEGTLNGNLITKAKVVLGQNAVIMGNIFAQNAEIGGQVNGVLEIKDLLVLKSSARVEGDIKTDKLMTEIGTCFNGNCQMKTQLNTPNQELQA